MKNLCFFLIALLLLSFSALAGNEELLKGVKEVSRFALGSCNKQYFPQTLWPQLMREAPDLWLWAGDNVYANDKDPDKIRAAYVAQNKKRDYSFFKSFTPIMGIWDDHDYTGNNANGKYPHKDQSQQYFLNFMEEPLLSPRRIQKGIYTTYEFGPEQRKIKFILLDTRFFMDVDKKAPLLGQSQWKWLEKELSQTSAKLIFIVSGIPILAPQMPQSEEWADYQDERRRLFYNLKKKANRPVLFLTGDKHFSSIYRGKQDYVEFMASGMTHTTRLPLRPYVRKKYPNYYFENNFGLVDIQWKSGNPVLYLTVKNAQGEEGLKKRLLWKSTKWLEF